MERNIESIKRQLGMNTEDGRIHGQNNKRFLDREEKKLGKIADKNSNIQTAKGRNDMRSKALKNHR